MIADRQLIGDNIRAARTAAHVNKPTLTALSYLAGYPSLYEQSIGRTERGERDLTLGEAVTLANVLGCSLDELIVGLPAEAGRPGLELDNE
jgi:transcriptional regulator with XRE-family HTH domain